jgi:hypothetical protein
MRMNRFSLSQMATHVAAVAVAVSCRGSEDKKHEPSAPFEAKPVQTAAATPPDAPAHDASVGSQLGFESAGIDAAKVIGQSGDAVSKALGQGTDDEHELPGGTTVHVLYDKGRAVGIEVFGTQTPWDEYTDEQKRIARGWFGLSSSAEVINGRKIVLGDAVEGLCLALYVRDAIPAIKRGLKRQDDEWQQSDQVKDMERAAIEGAANGLFRSFGITGLSHAEGDVLQIRTAREDCGRQLLADMKSKLVAKEHDLKRHFRVLQCWSGGVTGTELSTK